MSRQTLFLRHAEVSRASTDTLPADITDVALRRIVTLCLLSAAMALLGSLMCLGSLFGGGELFKTGYSVVEVTNDSLMMIVSLGVAWLVHRRKFAPRVLIGLGLGFGAYAAVWQCVAECYILIDENFLPSAYFSITQAWVVFFPAIVPVRSKATVFVILFTAATPILGRGLIDALGLYELPWDSQTILGIVMFFSVIMALAVSHVVYTLGKSVKAARELGSYTLERNLGSGGMGEVWEASHRMLARPAAVKLIKPSVLEDMAPGEIQRLNHRFEHEVQATAALQSPHTVDIYDYGLAHDGTFYYVMELLEGIDMETLVERFGPVEPERVVHYMIQVCHSLQEAHQRHLIHRDIKPANLFVCRYGEDFDFVKVLDFGLVKHEAAGSDAEMKVTIEGSVAGTPAYMYPEAVSGKWPVDHRSDVYSLGCVAYWLLTGQLVFSADSPMAMLVEHASAEPVQPSERCESGVPSALDEVVLACLQKDPENRPQSAAELANRLRAIEFAADWNQERARGWWMRHRPSEVA